MTTISREGKTKVPQKLIGNCVTKDFLVNSFPKTKEEGVPLSGHAKRQLIVIHFKIISGVALLPNIWYSREKSMPKVYEI